MQNLSDQEKKSIRNHEGVQAAVDAGRDHSRDKKEIRAGMASTDHNNIYGEIRETWIYRQT